MAGWIADALLGADVIGASRRAAISLTEVQRHRRQDPLFELGCNEVDQVVRLSALAQLEAQAASGNLKAVQILAAGIGQLLPDLLDLDAPDRLPPLKTDAEIPPPVLTVTRCRHCKREIDPGDVLFPIGGGSGGTIRH